MTEISSADPVMPLRKTCGEFVHWLSAQALPRWAVAGVDRLHGGFFEKLDRAGRPIEEPRRARVVTRQIYVFATAARRGWHPDADAIVEHGLRFLLGKQRQRDGFFAAAVRPDGAVVRGDFDLYEHAFVLFALAEACRGRSDRLALLAPEAASLLDAMRRRFGHAQGGFHESDPPTAPLRANPHMHLFEAALAWEQVAQGEAVVRWQALSDELARLATTRFIDPTNGALGETFDLQWRAAPDPAARSVEPGHQFEWSWLLHRYAEARGREDVHGAACALNRIGESAGLDPARGIAVNELDGTLAPRDRGGRLWPQTEWLKSACTAWQRTPGADTAQRVLRAAEGLRRFLFTPADGLWNERQRDDGGFEHDDVRASSLYHIVCAIDTLQAAMDRASSAGANP